MVYNVYLILAEIEEKKLYKIGYTKRDVTKRVKELKTGNPAEFSIIETFNSKWGIKIEKSMHQRFKHKKINGEWFDLNEKEVREFKSKCELYHKNFEALSKTTYFLEKGKFY